MQTNDSVDSSDVMKLSAERFTHEVEHAPGLVLVDFYADWCGPCHMVSPILEQLTREYAGRVKIAKVDTEAEPELSARFQVRSLPSVLYFRNGTLVDTVVGAYPRRMYEGKISEHL